MFHYAFRAARTTSRQFSTVATRVFAISTARPSSLPTENNKDANNETNSNSSKTIIVKDLATNSRSKPTPAHLLQRKLAPIKLDENELTEVFIKGGGKGGQKVNKAASCVAITHRPTGISVRTQRFRDLSSNRKEARKLLALELDDFWNGTNSKRNMEIKKMTDKKKRNATKAQKRLGAKLNHKKKDTDHKIDDDSGVKENDNNDDLTNDKR
ncbi:hypothetical protein HK100_005016 [Physocladia obscura]|uniref:Prokaryotic-type class I peptide chain release factors domain-containing protein n=1 Tax=Physocladia obscura TaxID=109957 RepID=A0AAD5X8E1_9FUNG|nr:hypothetical protein HK100_005016 [Physocladia obscura]